MTGRLIRGSRTPLAVGAVALLVAMAVQAGFGGWIAEFEARSARAVADPIAALEPLARAVERNPLQPRYRRDLDRRLEEAIAADGLERVAAAAPSAPLARFRFAVALAAAGANGEAARLATDAVPRRREDLEVLSTDEVLAIARFLAAASRCAEALPMFDAFHARGGATNRTDGWQGRCLLAMGHAESAIAPLERAAERAPDDRWVFFALAEARLAVGQPIEAEETTAALVEHEPGFYYGWRLRARVLERLQRFAEAGDAYGRASDLAPKKRSDRVDQGRMLLATGDAKGAAVLAAAVVAHAPDDRRATHLLADAVFARGDRGAALVTITQATERWPDFAAAWSLRGRILEAEARWREAAEAFARAASIDRARVSLRVDEARCRIRGGEPRRAIEILEPIVAMGAATHWSMFFLAEARLVAGDLEAADADAVAIAARWPEFYYSWQIRGRVLEAMGRREEAAGSFERALAIAPQKTGLVARIAELRSADATSAR